MRNLTANKQKMPLDSESRNIVMLSGLAVMIFIVMGFLAPKTFLSLTNLQGMCVQFAEFGILSYGMMLAMISGGIDLSLVGIANLTGIICSLVIKSMGGSGLSIILGIAAGLLVGVVCGTFNGFFIGYFQIPAMLVTLSGLQLYTGISLAITKGPAITGLPESFSQISNGKIFEIPYSLIIFTVITIALYYLMKSSIYGQHVSFMGTNPVASKYSGINNLKVTMLTYCISGILGSVAGILMASRYNSAKSDYGTSYTLLTLLIAVLGGINPNGGKGKVFGVTLSILVLQLVSSALNIMRVNSFIKTFIWGLMLIGIMTLTWLIDKYKGKKVGR